MPKPDFKQIIKTLEEYSQNLKENAQIGNSKLILAFAEMIRAMGWANDQADTNNTQIGNLTNEIKDLKIKLATYSSKSDKIYTLAHTPDLDVGGTNNSICYYWSVTILY